MLKCQVTRTPTVVCTTKYTFVAVYVHVHIHVYTRAVPTCSFLIMGGGQATVGVIKKFPYRLCFVFGER